MGAVMGKLGWMPRGIVGSGGSRDGDPCKTVPKPQRGVQGVDVPPALKTEVAQAPRARDFEQERCSSDYDEYDLAEEARKPLRLKGTQRDWTPTQDKRRYRAIIWQQRGGCWYGMWTWTAWEEHGKTQKRVEDNHERAMRAWNATEIPQEIPLRIVERVMESRLSVDREVVEAAEDAVDVLRIEGLANLALVCRAWYTMIAPALYSRLQVADGALGCVPRRSVTDVARRMTLYSTKPFVFCTRTSNVCPNLPEKIVWLVWRGPDDVDVAAAPSYHPSHIHMHALLHRAFSSVTRFDLARVHSLSSSDLLRLLSSLPALTHVGFQSISIAHVSNFVFVPPWHRESLIRKITVDDTCNPPCLAFILQGLMWTLSAPPPHELSNDEQRLVVSLADGMVTSIDLRVEYRLESIPAREDSDSRTWVLWSQHISRPSQPEFFEHFHTKCHISSHPPHGLAHVQSLLLRVLDWSAAYDILSDIGTTGARLAQLAHLEGIVLETRSRENAENTDAEPEGIRNLCEKVREASGVEVWHRTGDEGHQIALDVKTRVVSGSWFSASGLQVVSPFWFLGEHASEWQYWLSEKYWASLSDAEKTG